jgi:SHS2 domain-containing protein
MAGFEILEHTADVGLLATAPTVTGVFEQATRGMAQIAGIWRSTTGDEHGIRVEARDREGALVDWLSEVLYLHDTRNIALTRVLVDAVGETSVSGRIWSSPLDDADTAIQIKAVTYHQLDVRETSEGWSATVFFDI